MHAYLIIVHNEFELLNHLVEVLDDERNNLYIHVDKKIKNFDFVKIKNSVRKSQVFFIDRLKVTWGGDTLVKCEYCLLKEAFAKGYQYYHLISGVDFPIKSQAYIHDFFEKNNGVNYLNVTRDKNRIFDIITKRNTEYHLLQNIIGRNTNFSNPLYRLERRIIKLQRRLGINRLARCPVPMYKGSQWFSITHDLVEEILKQEKFVKKYFYKSYCPDELFINTIAMNTKTINVNPDNYLRYIDWNRGRPYVFKLEDYEELISSKALFARKFSYSTEDGKLLINKLKQYVLSEADITN